MPYFSNIDIDNFKRAFDLFDKDSSGSISRDVNIVNNSSK